MEINKEQIIGEGNTAQIYQLEHNKVLKLFRSGLNKGIVEKEYNNSVIVHNILDCVPKVYELVERNDRNGIIYEEVKGNDMLKIMSGSLGKVNDYAKKLAHYHASIQKPVLENLTSVKEKLQVDLQNTDLISDEKKEIIRKYLKQLPDGDLLCHFDFHPGNVMIENNKPVILDWMTACRGDACADVARTCLMLKYGQVAQVPWIVRHIISFFQRHIYKIYIKEYLNISKRSMEEIDRWELPVAAARLHEWIPEKEKKILLTLINKHCNEMSKN